MLQFWVHFWDHTHCYFSIKYWKTSDIHFNTASKNKTLIYNDFFVKNILKFTSLADLRLSDLPERSTGRREVPWVGWQRGWTPDKGNGLRASKHEKLRTKPENWTNLFSGLLNAESLEQSLKIFIQNQIYLLKTSLKWNLDENSSDSSLTYWVRAPNPEHRIV